MVNVSGEKPRAMKGANVLQAVISTGELNTANVARQSTTKICDPPIIVERASEPVANSVLLHMGSPLNLAMEHDVSSKDIVMVEDASDEDEDEIDTDRIAEDPIVAITAADGSTQSIDDIRIEEPKAPNDPPKEDVDTIDLKIEDCTGPPVHAPPLMTPAMRRRCKSYEKSSVRRSTRLAKNKVLKDLGIITNDGKLNENAILEYAECMKELLPPDLLESLMRTEGRAFWEVVAGISLPFR